jgi:hypothetical protein
MKRLLLFYLIMFGIDARKTIHSIKQLPYYFRSFQILKRQEVIAAKAFPFGKTYPVLTQRFSESGCIDAHYFYQDLLIAKRVFLNAPSLHVDVGSSIDGFVAHVASFRPIEVVDIRPLSIRQT